MSAPSEPLPPEQDSAKVREFITAAADAAKNAFRDAVRPIYGASVRGRPDHLGSSVLIEIDGVKMIVTAAHVIDHNSATTLYIGGDATLDMLEGEFQITAAPEADRNRDHYDFAFAELTPKQLSGLGDVRFVTEAEMVPASTPVEKRLYTAIGYPNSKNKDNLALANKVLGQLYPYSSIHCDEPVLAKRGLSRHDHVLITHHKKAVDETGRKTFPIGPRGLSGGAMIEATEISLALYRGQQALAPRLAGIIIERSCSRLIATRIHVVIATIRHHRSANVITAATP